MGNKMKCTKCNNTIHDVAFVYCCPKQENLIVCTRCLKLFTMKIRTSMYGMLKAFIEWLYLNEKEILEFQESNNETNCNRDTGTDQAPDS